LAHDFYYRRMGIGSTAPDRDILRASSLMPIRMWDYRAEYEAERDDLLAAVDQVLRSGQLILGDSVRAFEAEFSAYCGVGQGIGVNSGTDALTLALRALGVAPGDEVITTANTAIPTVSAIVTAGGTPRFVDIEPGTGLMDVGQVERAITERTRCVIPVHLYGQCVNMDALHEITAPRGIPLLEDCAQSTGAEYRGRRAGSMSDLAAFSFYPTKILGAFGDGGMVVTPDERLAARIRRLRVYGTDGSYYAQEHGYNSRLDELHAEILRRKLRRIGEYIERRRELARRYDERLRGSGLTLPVVRNHNAHVYHLYVVRHPERDAIIQALAGRGISVGVHYPWPLHLMPAYRDFGLGEGSLPATERAAREIWSLPLYPSLTDAEQDQICEAILKIASQTRRPGGA
jgi:aminotransferase EvaB